MLCGINVAYHVVKTGVSESIAPIVHRLCPKYMYFGTQPCGADFIVLQTPWVAERRYRKVVLAFSMVYFIWRIITHVQYCCKPLVPLTGGNR